MKAPLFAYAKPASLAEVFDCLEGGSDVRLLAGGQSLIPALNMRLFAPSLLVDINSIAELSGISEINGIIRIGAITRHHQLAASDLVATRLPLIAKAVPHIAHHAIRNRGTIGGSLSLADPSTELPACCLALGATIVAKSRKGERRIAAKDFFQGIYETALSDGEVLTAVEFSVPPEHSISGFDELARRHGDYAIVGLAAQGIRAQGQWSSLNLSFFGAGDRPLLANAAAQALVSGKDVSDAKTLLAEELTPSDDAECTAKTKMHMAGVLLGRVVKAMEGHAV